MGSGIHGHLNLRLARLLVRFELFLLFLLASGQLPLLLFHLVDALLGTVFMADEALGKVGLLALFSALVGHGRLLERLHDFGGQHHHVTASFVAGSAERV